MLQSFMGIPTDTLVTVGIAAGVIALSYFFLFSFGRKTGQSQSTTAAAEQCPYLSSMASLDDGNGDTPLQIACGNGDVEAVRVMLSVGSAAESAAGSKCPFAFASSSGANKAKSPHTQHVDVNAVNFDGETALMFAAENGHDAVVELLVQHSPLLDVGRRNKRGWSAFSLAARAGHLTTVKLLLAAEAPECKENEEGPEQQQRVASRLAVVDQQDRNGCTSLIHAAGQHRRDVVAFLLQQGADLRLRDADGVSCLMRALHRGALDISLDLIAAARTRLSAADADAFLNAQSVDGDSALSISSAFGHIDIVRALVRPEDTGAPSAQVPVHVQVNNQDALGFSPVMRAAARGHAEVVELLLAAGADESLTNIDGKTMHNVAILEAASVSAKSSDPAVVLN